MSRAERVVRGLKAATGNRGAYDPDDPDIRKARGGLAVKRKKK